MSLRKDESIFDTFFNAETSFRRDKQASPSIFLGSDTKEHKDESSCATELEFLLNFDANLFDLESHQVLCYIGLFFVMILTGASLST